MHPRSGTLDKADCLNASSVCALPCLHTAVLSAAEGQTIPSPAASAERFPPCAAGGGEAQCRGDAVGLSRQVLQQFQECEAETEA